MKNRRPGQSGPPNGGGNTPPEKPKTKDIADVKFRRVSILYGQGQELSFEFPIQTTESDMSHRVEEALKLPTLSISTGQALYVIPTSAISTIIVKPPPKRLPPTVIRGAKLKGVVDN